MVRSRSWKPVMGESPLQVRVLCAALNTKKTSEVLAIYSRKIHISTLNGGHMPGEDVGSLVGRSHYIANFARVAQLVEQLTSNQ